MAGVDTQQTARRRLKREMKDLSLTPVIGIGAMPLETNMMEWHCNILCQETIYHLILFFPDAYPGTSPSAEFVPTGFQFRGGATKNGRKGTQVCLSIFSDFKDYHPEWEKDSSAGWSPAYTVEKVLLNLVSFMEEQMTGSASFVPSFNKRLAEGFTCSDCGHCYNNPVPEIYAEPEAETSETDKSTSSGEVGGAGDAAKSATGGVKELASGLESMSLTGDDVAASSEASKDPAATDSSKEDVAAAAIEEEEEEEEEEEVFPITCYMLLMEVESVDHVPEDDTELFGFGLSWSGNFARPRIVSPCEYLCKAAFDFSLKNTHKVLTSYREEIHYFLPLYIHANHASKIQGPFEAAIKSINDTHQNYFPSGYRASTEHKIMKLLPGLMCSAVVNFSKSKYSASDNHLSGYFVLHRLLLWALDTYPKLEELIEEKIKVFKDEEKQRSKKSCPDIGDWLMFLSVSKKYRWKDVADAYLGESMRRNVQWYLKECPELAGENIPNTDRLGKTFRKTTVSNTLLAFQVAFLDVAWPESKSTEQVKARYDNCMGRPTAKMIRVLKAGAAAIEKISSYQEWYPKTKLEYPGDDELCVKLQESVKFAQKTDGYYFTAQPGPVAGVQNPPGAGRNRGRRRNRGRGRADDPLMNVAEHMFD